MDIDIQSLLVALNAVHGEKASLDGRVTLSTKGNDMEFDEKIAEAISAPPAHLVRDSVDHRIELTDERMGVPVDRPSDVIAIFPSDLQPSPTNIFAVDSRLMRGVSQLEDELTVVLRVKELLATPEASNSAN